MDNTSLLGRADGFGGGSRLAPRLNFHKTDKPAGAERRKVNFPAMGFDAPAQNPVTLQPQPPGRQAFAALAAGMGGAAGRVSHAIFLL